MANEKEFTTITLRNLNSPENKGIVKIMNNVLNTQGIKTGQGALEFIVTDYEKLQTKLENERKTRISLERELSELRQSTDARIAELTGGYLAFSQFSNVLKTIKK